MPKYLLLEHYNGGPERNPNFVPMSERTEDEITAHMAFQRHVGELLRQRGEFVYVQALSPEGTYVRYGGPGAAPVTTDGPFSRDQGTRRRLVHDRRRVRSADARGCGVPFVRAGPCRRAPGNTDRRCNPKAARRERARRVSFTCHARKSVSGSADAPGGGVLQP
jgi:hypothetical protein